MKKREERIFIYFWKKNRRQKETFSDGQEVNVFRWPLTISAYSRAVRRIQNHYDCCPDRLTKDQLENYFGDLIKTHSWSTVKIDRLGLMFFWKNVLELDWQWLDMVKPPQIKSIPDILTPSEIERLICATQKMRYRVFLLATYSMGLRLTEALSLEVGDIDSERHLIHIQRDKGHKDRMVPLPNKTLEALRILWSKHRHPRFLFPNARGSMKTIQKATTHMNIGGTQNAKTMRPVAGLTNNNPSCYPCPTLWSHSPYHMNSGAWSGVTKKQCIQVSFHLWPLH